MTDEQRILHRRALLGLDAVVGQVEDADLGRPTPCGGWDLAALLAHLVGQDRGLAAAARDGERRERPGSAFARSLPDPGTDPWERVLALLGRDPGWVPTTGAPIVGT
jgi:uncharacterized protein (TIGR03083 family)